MLVLEALRQMPYETHWDAGGERYCFSRADFEHVLKVAEFGNPRAKPLFAVENQRSRGRKAVPAEHAEACTRYWGSSGPCTCGAELTQNN
jgi:hypothetical protein